MSTNINIKKLEADLWESADELRANSKLTSNQYCMPVLALLLLGRLCSLCISLRLRKISQGPLQKSALCAILCDKE